MTARPHSISDSRPHKEDAGVKQQLRALLGPGAVVDGWARKQRVDLLRELHQALSDFGFRELYPDWERDRQNALEAARQGFVHRNLLPFPAPFVH